MTLLDPTAPISPAMPAAVRLAPAVFAISVFLAALLLFMLQPSREVAGHGLTGQKVCRDCIGGKCVEPDDIVALPHGGEGEPGIADNERELRCAGRDEVKGVTREADNLGIDLEERPLLAPMTGEAAGAKADHGDVRQRPAMASAP
jgi:hypothetical protein